MRSWRQSVWIGLACVLGAAGCSGDDTGSGDVVIEVAANQAIRQGFPHEEAGMELAFVDGWEFEVTAFLVAIEDVELRTASETGDGEVVASMAEMVIVDLASDETGSVEIGVIEDAPATRVDFGFSTARATAAARVEGASSEDVQAMIDGGYMTFIRGVATPEGGGDPIEIAVGSSVAATYTSCINGKDGTKGMAVENNTSTNVFIYPHLVHLFWDTLGAGDEDLRFAPWAAAAGDDNLVTNDDLETVDLTAVLGDDGVPLYDDSGLLDTYTLRAFVERGMAESMHFNGIGFCRKTLR